MYEHNFGDANGEKHPENYSAMFLPFLSVSTSYFILFTECKISPCGNVLQRVIKTQKEWHTFVIAHHIYLQSWHIFFSAYFWFIITCIIL
jgi:hypothetical protein